MCASVLAFLIVCMCIKQCYTYSKSKLASWWYFCDLLHHVQTVKFAKILVSLRHELWTAYLFDGYDVQKNNGDEMPKGFSEALSEKVSWRQQRREHHISGLYYSGYTLALPKAFSYSVTSVFSSPCVAVWPAEHICVDQCATCGIPCMCVCFSLLDSVYWPVAVLCICMFTLIGL